MEGVVPGRGPAGSPHRYTWDDEGGIDTLERLPSETKERSTGRKMTTNSSSTKRTIRWPFQSFSSRPDTPSTTIPLSASFANQRRRGSTPLSAVMRPASSIMDLDIIPDYVVNFIRGETPESLAQKRDRQARQSEFQAQLHQGHNRDDSRAAEFFFSGLSAAEKDAEKGVRSSPRQVKSLLTGWRGGVALNVVIGFVVLVAVVACLIISAINAGALGGESDLIRGQCDEVRDANLGLHALVNALAFMLIAGANYVFQVISSPTRDEVDAAHTDRQWLDIGLPSPRNLWILRKGRGLLGLFALILAVSSQVLFNSLTYTLDLDDSCSLALSRTSLGVVAILNLLAVITAIVTLLRSATFEPLVTLGDALSSFLENPDPSTRGAGLITKHDACSTTRPWISERSRSWEAATPSRWAFTASATRWILWASSWVLPVVLSGVSLGVSLGDNTNNAFTIESFGRPSSTHSVSGTSIPRVGLAILVSLPHLLLAVLYLSTNGLLTNFFFSRELSRFAVPGHLAGLRVSSGSPLGAQTASLYLTLPRPISWLLFALFAAAGFVLSQAIFIVSADADKLSVGLGALALVILLGILFIIGLLVLTLSLLRVDSRGSAHPGEDAGQQGAGYYTDDDTTAHGRGGSQTSKRGSGAGNPLALIGGSCSAVISSRCHPDLSEGPDLPLQPLGWGVVREEMGSEPGRATFSSQPLGVVRVGRAYV